MMERRTFIKLMAVVGGAVAFRGKDQPRKAPLPPTTLQAIEVTSHQDLLEATSDGGWREHTPGQRWTEWKVQLKPGNPWVRHLSVGTKIDVEVKNEYGGIYRGRAAVTGVYVTPTEVTATLVGGKVVYYSRREEVNACKTV